MEWNYRGKANNAFTVTGVKIENKSSSGNAPYQYRKVTATCVSRSPATKTVDETVFLTDVKPSYIYFYTQVDDTEVNTSAYAVMNDNSRVFIGSLNDSGDNGSGGWKVASKTVYLSTVAALSDKIDSIKAIECHASGSWLGHRITDGWYADIYIYATQNTWH